MKKATATTQQLEPENYALGLSKEQVQDLYVLSLLAVIAFVLVMLAQAIGGAIIKAVLLLRLRKQKRKIMKQLEQSMFELAQETLTTNKEETN